MFPALYCLLVQLFLVEYHFQSSAMMAASANETSEVSMACYVTT